MTEQLSKEEYDKEFENIIVELNKPQYFRYIKVGSVFVLLSIILFTIFMGIAAVSDAVTGIVVNSISEKQVKPVVSVELLSKWSEISAGTGWSLGQWYTFCSVYGYYHTYNGNGDNWAIINQINILN